MSIIMRLAFGIFIGRILVATSEEEVAYYEETVDGVDGIVSTSSVLPSLNGASNLFDHPSSNANSNAAGAGPPDFDSSSVIVRFEDGASPSFLPGSGKSTPLNSDGTLYLTTLPPGLSVASAVRSYAGKAGVRYSEPNYVVSAIATPNDPFYAAGAQWDMTLSGAEGAWDEVTDCSGVQVAVIDTGIDFSHPDLAGNMYTVSRETNHVYDELNVLAV